MKGKSSLRRRSASACAAAAFAALAGLAGAQGTCATAIIMSGPVPQTQPVDTTSTPDGGAISCITAGGTGGNDVWVRLPPLTAGTTYWVDTIAGSITDTVLEVYATTTGCAGLTQIACDDDLGPGLLSQVSFTATALNSYFVRAESWGTGGGTFSIRIRFAPPPASNDTCATATVINPAALPYSDFIIVSGCTDTGNFTGTGTTGGKDCFWSFTPTITEQYLLTGANTDAGGTMCLGIWTGACGALTPVVIQGPVVAPSILQNLTSGTPYWFIWDDGFPGSAPDTVSIDFNIAPPPPANNLCSGATVINPASLPFNEVVPMIAATDEGLDNSASVGFGGGGGRDIFYSFTPTITAPYSVSAQGADYGIGIFTGTCGALTEVAAKDDTFGGETLFFTFNSGTTYTILAEGYNASVVGTMDFTLAGPFLPPANDLCSNATVINPATLPFSDTVNMAGAGNEGLDNSASVGFGGGGGTDVFYSFTPTVTAVYRSIASGYDLGIGIYTGACGSLTEIAAIDNTFAGETILTGMTSGVTYTIMPEGFSAADVGTLTFQFQGPFFPSANDTCATATTVTEPLPYSNTVNVAFNTNTGDFDDDGAGSGVDAFWSYTPTVSNRYMVVGTNTDAGGTMCIGWWSGVCGALVRIDVAGPVVSPIALANCTAGTTYYIVYDDAFPGSAPDTASITVDIAPPPPANDLCSGATVINPAALPYFDSVDNTYAGDEGLDNSRSVFFGGGGGKDVFYSFTPTVTAGYQVSATGFDTGIGAYTGTCGALTEIAAVDETFGGESFVVSMTSGTAYTLMPEGFSAADVGTIAFSVSTPIFPPPNDLCSNAITVTEPLTFTDVQDTAGAGDEGLDNSRSLFFGGGGGKDVFYSYTPTVTAGYQVSASGFDTGIGVFTGACGSLTEIAAADETFGGETLLVTLSSGVAATILCEGFGPTDTGTLTTTVDGPFLAPPNDLCINAIALTEGTPSASYSLAAANDEGTNGLTIQPFVGGTSAKDVFFTFTPASTGTYRIRQTEGSGGAPAVSCHTGTCGTLTEVAGTFIGAYNENEASELNARLNSGTSYTIAAESVSPAGSGTVTVTGPIAEPAGDRCATAIAQVGPGVQTVNVNDMVNDIINSVTLNILGAPVDLGGRDAFFLFTPAVTGLHSFSVTGGADLSIAAFGTPCGPSGGEIAAADDFFPSGGFNPATYSETETISGVFLGAGGSIYIVVDGFTWDDNSEFGAWTVTFTQPATVEDWSMHGE